MIPCYLLEESIDHWTELAKKTKSMCYFDCVNINRWSLHINMWTDSTTVWQWLGSKIYSKPCISDTFEHTRTDKMNLIAISNANDGTRSMSAGVGVHKSYEQNDSCSNQALK